MFFHLEKDTSDKIYKYFNFLIQILEKNIKYKRIKLVPDDNLFIIENEFFIIKTFLAYYHPANYEIPSHLKGRRISNTRFFHEIVFCGDPPSRRIYSINNTLYTGWWVNQSNLNYLKELKNYDSKKFLNLDQIIEQIQKNKNSQKNYKLLLKIPKIEICQAFQTNLSNCDMKTYFLKNVFNQIF